MSEALQKFDEDQLCVKCGSDDINYVWRPENKEPFLSRQKYGSGPREEHIDCRCQRCRYEWYVKPINDEGSVRRDD